jgi:kojibiose phosphorylase
MRMNLRAVIFDLDGVITDTAEYHYQAWQRLADEEGLPFDRTINERLRGVGRRESLEIILAGRPVTEAQLAGMMQRKNDYYVALLQQITPANLLPGALELLAELRGAGIKIGIGSVSKNTWTVINRLGIGHLLDAVADSYSAERSKPAPDIFLAAAQMLAAPPAACAVVEDAAAGIEAALTAGMWAIGVGPIERVRRAHARCDDLAGVRLADILQALEDAGWVITEPAFDPVAAHHRETIFTIGNGNLCVRGTFEEGYPGEHAGCFMHRLWDDMPVHYTELANLPRWWGVDIWANGVRFRLDRGKILHYRRWLDLRNGALCREVRWQPTEDGPVLDLHFERLVSLADPHPSTGSELAPSLHSGQALNAVKGQVLAAVQVKVEIVAGQAEVRLRTGLDAHVENQGLVHWDVLAQEAQPDAAALSVCTRATGLELALAAAVNTSGTARWRSASCDSDGHPAIERRASLRGGKMLTLEKFIGLVSELDADEPRAAATDLVRAAQAMGYAAIRAANDDEWARTWASSDVIIEGDNLAQAALRFGVFQLLIAAPRHTDRASIGAKTLSGLGYRHHIFWDTEIFMLPFFNLTQPRLARNMLMYRWHGLAAAREKARANGYEGAQYPWESAADGHEVTPAWVVNKADPRQLIRIWTGDIEIHITADVAYGVMQYWRVTADDAFMADYGAEIVLDGAKFWASAAALGTDDRYHYRNVIGPDENHDRVDDNAYTNYLARWHLRTALEALAWLKAANPGRAAALVEALDLSESRLAHWADVAGRIYLSHDVETGLIEQFAGFFGLPAPDLRVMRDPQRTKSMQALLGIEGCAAVQVLKQPDVLMLQYLLPDLFTEEQLGANFEYYDPRTDHELGSSLGPSISAIMALRAGAPDVAYRHFQRAAAADLLDVRGNTSDGIHGASAGGVWQAAVFGFGGLRITDGGWETRPCLPAGWTRLAFKFYERGKLQAVEIRG